MTVSCCFQAPRQLCWCLRPPVLRFLVIFFHPTDRPTRNQETYSTLNERKRDDLSLMVSFWASSPHCFCVFLYTFLLLFLVLFCRWNKLKLYRDPQYSLCRFSNAHKENEKCDDLLAARAMGWVRARYCAPVHSCAVKWSRTTKWLWTDYSRLDIKHLLRWDLSCLLYTSDAADE